MCLVILTLATGNQPHRPCQASVWLVLIVGSTAFQCTNDIPTTPPWIPPCLKVARVYCRGATLHWHLASNPDPYALNFIVHGPHRHPELTKRAMKMLLSFTLESVVPGHCARPSGTRDSSDHVPHLQACNTRAVGTLPPVSGGHKCLWYQGHGHHAPYL